MIRPARPEDAEAACALVQAGFAGYSRFTPGWSAPNEFTLGHIDETAEAFARPDAFGRVEVTAENGLEGVVLWLVPPPERASRDGWLPEAHLRWLFVAEHRWGDGLARRLHGLAIEAMRRRGVRTARLYTPRAHARARAFYEREGWRTRLEPYVDEFLGLEVVEYGLAPT